MTTAPAMAPGAARSPIPWAAIPASTPAEGLPRSRVLTAALLSDTGPTEGAAVGTRAVHTAADAATVDAATAPATVDAASVVALREHLDRGLSAVVANSRAVDDGPDEGKEGGAWRRQASATVLRIGQYQVARVLPGHGSARLLPDTRDGPGFRWTSRAARRSIGLAALRLGLDGRVPTPADAVALVLSDPGGPFGVGRTGPGSCADWLTALAPPARSMVAGEATTWTTRIWTALDWGRIDPAHLVVGGPDRWWRWSATPRGADRGAGAGAGAVRQIAVRGRADLRITAAPGGDPSDHAQLVVLDGQPGPATRHALLLRPLVEVLSGSRSPGASSVPARVVGWWPDCGKAWVVPVDAPRLARAADAVVMAAAALLRSGAPGGWAPGQ